jgi:hypothetical protein
MGCIILFFLRIFLENIGIHVPHVLEDPPRRQHCKSSN